MSSIIPPLLSSSPPPMVSTIILDDEDDEFGNFTMATDFNCDTDVPLPTEIIPQINGIDDELDRRKTDENKNQDCSTKYNNFQYFPEIPPDIIPETCDLATTDDDDKEVSEILDNTVTNCPELDEVKSNSEPDLQSSFANFHTFTTDHEVHEILESTPESPTNFVQPNFENLEAENEDEFGDFNDYSLQTNSPISEPLTADEIVNIMFPISENTTEEYIEEDLTKINDVFVQLKDITDTSALMYQWGKSNSQNFLLQALNIDTRNILYGPRWNESMPRYAATLGFAPLEPLKSDNVGNVELSQDLVQPSDIPSAEFDWVGSGLTNPLEITPTKIMEKQQSNSDESKHTIEKITQTHSQTSDDNDSINSLKLSDKRDNDFDDFHSFQSSTIEEHYDNWPMSLRETHISNVKFDEPGWLKPTILTPDLPRKKLECEEEFANFQSGNFDNGHDTKISPNQDSTIQINEQLSSLKPELPTLDVLKPSIPCQLEQSHIKEHVSSYETPLESPISIQETAKEVDDDEFTEFQSTTFAPIEPVHTILEPLQPSILQPIKVENTAPPTTSTTINWPDPGITDEDLQRFSLYKPNVQETVTNDVKNVDEDDWSDFVSNQTTQLSNLEINKPIQNGFQTSLVSNQYVVLASKPDEIEDEWSDFVSSQPPPIPQTVSRPPRSSIPKLNLDWNGPPQFSSWSASITPNIITNPASFESFRSFTSFDGDLLKNKIGSKKTPNIMVQPKKSTVPSISSIPDLEFIAPKNRTWKK